LGSFCKRKACRWNYPLKNLRHGSTLAAVKVKGAARKKVVRRPRGTLRALLVVDNHPLREKARRNYDEALRELNEVRAELERFDKEDKPRFMQWLRLRFGRLISEIRDSKQKLTALQRTLLEVEDEVFWNDLSHSEAYARVASRREQEEMEKRAEDPPDDAADPNHESTGHEFHNDDAEDARSRWRIPRDGEAFDQDVREEGGTGPVAARLKELYRALVRRLHPDLQGEMSPQQVEWWHQAQEAYQAGDSDRLQVILTLCETAETGPGQASISVLVRMTIQLRDSAARLRSDLSLRQREPAWNFARRPDVYVLDFQTRNSLEEDLVRFRCQIERIQAVLAEWQKGPKRRRSRRVSASF
jgi:hypothetical protein